MMGHMGRLTQILNTWEFLMKECSFIVGFIYSCWNLKKLIEYSPTIAILYVLASQDSCIYGSSSMIKSGTTLRQIELKSLFLY